MSLESSSVNGFVVFDIGCAECRGYSEDEPLVESLTFFDTLEQAQQAHPEVTKWNPHPLGGVFDGRGDGDIWIAPLSTFGA